MLFIIKSRINIYLSFVYILKLTSICYRQCRFKKTKPGLSSFAEIVLAFHFLLRLESFPKSTLTVTDIRVPAYSFFKGRWDWKTLNIVSYTDASTKLIKHILTVWKIIKFYYILYLYKVTNSTKYNEARTDINKQTL